MDCEHCQNLMSEVILKDPDVSEQERQACFNHLEGCWFCHEQYERECDLAELLRNYGKLSPDTVELLESHGGIVPDYKRLYPKTNNEIEITEEMTEASLQQMLAKLDAAEALRKCQQESWDEAASEHTTKIQKMVFAISRKGSFRRHWYVAAGLAVAACLLIITSVWLDGLGGLPVKQPVSLTHYANDNIELITTSGKQSLAHDKPIHCDQGTKELLLGGTHKVILNRNTTVTITTAFIANDRQVAWNLELASGELYVEVTPNLPGGTRFAVTTPNALATITGTKFNVLTDSSQTELALLKGSVRFTSLVNKQVVDVTTGHISMVLGRSAPTTPMHVDVQAITSWARHGQLRETGEVVTYSNNVEELFGDTTITALMPEIPDYRTWSYERFREEMRPWFAEQFPWVMELEKVLNEESSVEVDYLDVLVISGDIWQFRYDNTLSPNQAFADVESTAAEHLSNWYGLDANAPVLTRTFGQTTTNPLAKAFDGTIYGDALTRWRKDLLTHSSSDENLLRWFSMRAGIYLHHTRAAVYIWSRQHPAKVNRLLKQLGYCRMYLYPLLSTEPMLSSLGLHQEVAMQLELGRQMHQLSHEWSLNARVEYTCSPGYTAPNIQLGQTLSQLGKNDKE